MHARYYVLYSYKGTCTYICSLAYFAAEASWFPAPARRPRSGLAARPPFSAARGAMATRDDPPLDYKVLYLRNMSFRLDKESGGRGRGAKKLRNARARARLLNILCAVRAGVHMLYNLLRGLPVAPLPSSVVLFLFSGRSFVERLRLIGMEFSNAYKKLVPYGQDGRAIAHSAKNAMI